MPHWHRFNHPSNHIFFHQHALLDIPRIRDSTPYLAHLTHLQTPEADEGFIQIHTRSDIGHIFMHGTFIYPSISKKKKLTPSNRFPLIPQTIIGWESSWISRSRWCRRDQGLWSKAFNDSRPSGRFQEFQDLSGRPVLQSASRGAEKVQDQRRLAAVCSLHLLREYR